MWSRGWTLAYGARVVHNMSRSLPRQFRNAMRFSAVSENTRHFRSVISRQLRQ